jgi:hypothetical protein
MTSVLIFLFILALIFIFITIIGIIFPLIGFLTVCLIGIIIIWIKIIVWLEKRREKKLGYSVEFISENVLRGAPKQFAAVYHEGQTSKCFYGERKGSKYILDLSFPYADKNDPRILMQQRMISELNRKFKKRIIITI